MHRLAGRFAGERPLDERPRPIWTEVQNQDEERLQRRGARAGVGELLAGGAHDPPPQAAGKARMACGGDLVAEVGERLVRRLERGADAHRTPEADARARGA